MSEEANASTDSSEDMTPTEGVTPPNQMSSSPISSPSKTVYGDNSTAALVLGLCGIIPFAGIVTAILAVVVGTSTLKGISAGDVPVKARIKAQAGRILGAVFGLLSLLISVLVVLDSPIFDDSTTCSRQRLFDPITCVEDSTLS